VLRVTLFPLLLATSSMIAADSPKTVILVRHAERAGGMAADIGISPTGRCRAEGLARMLADAGITRIYTSEVARTQQTAEPLAKKLGVKPQVVAAKEVDNLAAKLRAAPGTALVVGHSNTLPEIIKRLSGSAVPPIDDAEYGNLYVVTLSDASQAAVLILHYPGCSK
jgi:broad specificity phosphatase PhoE